MVCPVFGWFVGGLAGLWLVWVVCGQFGCFVGGLDGLWVVSSFIANVEIGLPVNERQFSKATITKNDIFFLHKLILIFVNIN